MRNASLTLAALAVAFAAVLQVTVYAQENEPIEKRLLSNDLDVRMQAVDELAVKGKEAIPKLRELLESENDLLVQGACGALTKMEGDTWQDALPEVRAILSCAHSAKTDAAAALVQQKGYGCEMDRGFGIKWKHFQDTADVKRNICIYLVHESGKTEFGSRAVKELGKIGDVKSVEALVSIMKNIHYQPLRQRSATALGETCGEGAVRPLVEAMQSDGNIYTRKNAARALGVLGDKRALEPLLKQLDDRKGVAWQAAWSLGRLGDKRAVAPLIVMLSDNANEDIHLPTILSLGRLGDSRAVKPLISALKSHPNFMVRKFAADALGEIGDKKAVKPLIHALEKNETSDVRNHAAMNLALFNEKDAVSALQKAAEENTGAQVALAWLRGGKDLEKANRLEIDDTDLRSCLTATRVRWGDIKLVPRLFSGWPHFSSPPEVLFQLAALSRLPEGFPKYDYKASYYTRSRQTDAVRAWYKKHGDSLRWDKEKQAYYLGPDPWAPEGRTIAKIKQFLASEDDYIVFVSLRELGKRDKATIRELFPSLEGILKAELTYNTATACNLILKAAESWLEQYQIEPGTTLNLLLGILKYGAWWDRDSAAEALGEIGDKKVVPALMQALKSDPHEYVRNEAAQALGEIGDKSTVDALIEALGDSYWGVRSDATKALGAIGGEKASKTLIGLLTDSNAAVQQAATNALGALREKRAVPTLMSLLKDKSLFHGVRLYAISALGDIGDKRALNALIQAFKKPESDFFKDYAVTALGRIGDESVVDLLVGDLERQPDASIRRSIVEALGEIKGAKAIASVIGAFEKDTNKDVREEAALVLGNWESKKVVEPLIRGLQQDKNEYVRTACALSLANYNGEEVAAALKKAHAAGIAGATIALAWSHGGDYLKNIEKVLESHSYLKDYVFAAQMVSGKSSAIEGFLKELPTAWPIVRSYYADALLTMPKECPVYHLDAVYLLRYRQAKKALRWFRLNRSRIAWDAEKRRYNLKPESPKQE